MIRVAKRAGARIAVVLLLTLAPLLSFADMASELRKFVGYTIVDVKTIAGWQDKAGKKGDAFEGCDYGRVILFADNKVATCSSYGYQYAYRPEAVILFKQGSFKMIVGSDSYDLQR